ncbi:MAG: type II toxin-antitoxin system VapC family toxin [Chthoniobacterales bacterium]
MSAYWDASALVEACLDEGSRVALAKAGGVTRAHSFAEVFSTLTGGRLGFRSRPEDAAVLCRELAKDLHVVELSLEETLAALESARHHGVRGGLVHDFLHAVAAQKADADNIYTLNLDDFRGLRLPIEILVPPSG